MKNILKKVISIGIAAGLLTISAFAEFVDMPSDETQKAALLKAVSNGLLNGVGDDRIAPYETITRSQMGAIIVRSMGAGTEADISGFNDISKDAWYYGEMSRAVYMGAFKGDGGSNLYPDKEITYQEAFLVLSRVFDLRYKTEGCLDKFSDKDSVSEWAKDGAEKIVSGGYYTGITLNAQMPISRVEFAMIMDKLVANYIDKPGTYNELPKGNTLVRCDGVVLDGIKLDENSHDLIIIGDGVKSAAIVNADGVNAAVRGGNVSLSGIFGVVRTVMPGTVLTPDTKNISVKTYADGSRGVISADVEGSYISFESVVE